jgi:hypothetical protein
MRPLLVILATFVAVLSGCGEDSRSYSIEEAQSAFAEHGYVLVDPPPDPAGFAPNPWQTGEPKAFVPERGPDFFVFVGDVEDRDALWTQYDPDHGPQAFSAQRGNVLVLSDSPLAAEDRERVGSALEALPGGGDVVVEEAS